MLNYAADPSTHDMSDSLIVGRRLTAVSRRVLFRAFGALTSRQPLHFRLPLRSCAEALPFVPG